MNEEQFKEAILNRLSMKDGQIETAVRRFVQLERSVNQIDEPKKLIDEVTKSQASIAKELDQYLFQVEKEQLIFAAYQRDCDNYKDLFKVKDSQIRQVKQEIGELKMKLKNEQQSKRNREEYMTLTKHINKHPKRHETEKAINEVKKELAAVEARAREITNEFEAKSKQFQLVLYAVNLLQEEMSAAETRKRKLTESTDTAIKRQKIEELSEGPISDAVVDLNIDLTADPDTEAIIPLSNDTTTTVTVTEMDDTPTVEVEDVYKEDVEVEII